MSSASPPVQVHKPKVITRSNGVPVKRVIGQSITSPGSPVGIQRGATAANRNLGVINKRNRLAQQQSMDTGSPFQPFDVLSPVEPQIDEEQKEPEKPVEEKVDEKPNDEPASSPVVDQPVEPVVSLAAPVETVTTPTTPVSDTNSTASPTESTTPLLRVRPSFRKDFVPEAISSPVSDAKEIRKKVRNSLVVVNDFNCILPTKNKKQRSPSVGASRFYRDDSNSSDLTSDNSECPDINDEEADIPTSSQFPPQTKPALPPKPKKRGRKDSAPDNNPLALIPDEISSFDITDEEVLSIYKNKKPHLQADNDPWVDAIMSEEQDTEQLLDLVDRSKTDPKHLSFRHFFRNPIYNEDRARDVDLDIAMPTDKTLLYNEIVHSIIDNGQDPNNHVIFKEYSDQIENSDNVLSPQQRNALLERTRVVSTSFSKSVVNILSRAPSLHPRDIENITKQHTGEAITLRIKAEHFSLASCSVNWKTQLKMRKANLGPGSEQTSVLVTKCSYQPDWQLQLSRNKSYARAESAIRSCSS